MKKMFFLLMGFAGLSLSAQMNKPIVLSDSAKISLLTCSSGTVVYERFGHSAIRIQDPLQAIDWAANWGVFSFTPDFYLKFIQGATWYQLEVYSTYHFLESYRLRGSSVIEQELNLNQEEKQRLMDAVMNNYLPENKHYLYNYVHDNCATRVREIINGAITTRNIIEPMPIADKTFRQWIAHYVGTRSWAQFGIDLLLGKEADQMATPVQTMFLPEMVCLSYDSATVAEGSVATPLVTNKRVLIEVTRAPLRTLPVNIPLFVTSLLFIAGIITIYYERKNKKHLKILDFSLLLVTGLAGMLIFYLMFVSLHPLVKSNFNALWCFPLNLIGAILVWIKNSRGMLKIYQAAYSILILIAFGIAVSGLQGINIASLPLMALMLFRSLHSMTIQIIK